MSLKIEKGVIHKRSNTWNKCIKIFFWEGELELIISNLVNLKQTYKNLQPIEWNFRVQVIQKMFDIRRVLAIKFLLTSFLWD